MAKSAYAPPRSAGSPRPAVVQAGATATDWCIPPTAAGQVQQFPWHAPWQTSGIQYTQSWQQRVGSGAAIYNGIVIICCGHEFSLGLLGKGSCTWHGKAFTLYSRHLQFDA